MEPTFSGQHILEGNHTLFSCWPDASVRHWLPSEKWSVLHTHRKGRNTQLHLEPRYKCWRECARSHPSVSKETQIAVYVSNVSVLKEIPLRGLCNSICMSVFVTMHGESLFWKVKSSSWPDGPLHKTRGRIFSGGITWPADKFTYQKES